MSLVRLWGFPWLPPGLTHWLCSLQGDCGAARWDSWLSKSVFLPQRSSFKGNNRIFFSTEEVGWTFLATGEGGEENSSLHSAAVLTLGVQTSVSECYIAQF